MAQPKNALPKSGLPGLVYRRRGNGGSWIVVVFVPTHLHSLLVNSKGKPLTRLERSTGTSDLKLAKARYAEIRTALQREIEQRSGSPLPSAGAGPDAAGNAQELRQFRLNRVLGESLLKLSGDQVQHLQSEASARVWAEEILQSNLSTQELQALVKHIRLLLLLLTEQLITDAGLPVLSEQDTALVAAGMRHTIEVAREEHRSKASVGVLHTPSPEAQQLQARATAAVPVTLDQLIRQGATDWSDGTARNYRGLFKRWMECIGDPSLKSLTTANLNRFARFLHLPKNQGGRGYGKDAANDAAYRLRSLISRFNAQLDAQQERIALPDIDAIPITQQDRKQRRLKSRTLAITDANATAIASYAAKQGPIFLHLVVLLRLTGLRCTEAATLRWDHIIEKDGFPLIDLLDSKTPDGIRLIPINQKLQRYLLPFKPD